MISLLVKNMGDPKNPWDDVPVEVLIELPIDSPDYRSPPREEPDTEEDQEHKIVIKLF